MQSIEFSKEHEMKLTYTKTELVFGKQKSKICHSE